MITPQMQALKDNPQRRNYLAVKRAAFSATRYANLSRTSCIFSRFEAASFYNERLREYLNFSLGKLDLLTQSQREDVKGLLGGTGRVLVTTVYNILLQQRRDSPENYHKFVSLVKEAFE